MAELEESIYSYSGTLQQKAFPGCTDIHNTATSQSTALARTRGHEALRTAEESTQQNQRLNSLPPQNPIKKKSLSITKSRFLFFRFIKSATLEGV